MSRFYDIDLARLPPLPLDAPSFDAVREARGAELVARLTEEGFAFDVQDLETDPMIRAVARAGGVRELLAIARRDDAIRAVMLATSWGAFLDHLGATQTPAVARLPLVASPRPYVTNPEDWEEDDPFRRRIQLAPEMLSAAGPEGAYLGYALGTPGVKAAAAWAPMSFGGTIGAPFTPLGEVRVPIVAVAGDGTAPPALVASVLAELRPRDRRPVADFVTVSAAEIVPYRIEAVLFVGGGADRDLVKREADKRFLRQALRQHRPGAAQTLRMLAGAASVPDAAGAIIVEDFTLIAPAADVNATPITPATPGAAYRAPYCTEIVTRVEVVDD